MSSVLLALMLAAIARGTTTYNSPASNGYVHPTNGLCIDYTVEEQVTWPHYDWTLPKFENNFDVAVYLYNTATKHSAEFYHPISSRPKNVTGTYELSATFCVPKEKKGGKEQTVLLTTHGGGYDRRYWASTYKPEEYNFVQAALESGYSVFYYDRIGTGKSQHISGYDAGLHLQSELAAKIAMKMRAGHYTNNITASKVVLVGHSLGSFISQGAIAKYPDLVDGAVLTGLAYPSGNDTVRLVLPWTQLAMALRLGSTLDQPFDRDTGYIGFGDIYAHTSLFFHEPLDIPTIEYAQSIDQPTAVQEFATGNLILSQIAPTFKGKILLTTGANDMLLCGGNCTETYATGGQNDVFPRAEVLKTYLHPSAGHGVNFAANSSGFYDVITEFLDDNF